MKNLKIIFTVLLVYFNLFCFSQQTAFFETTLYFEDAVGNRDTIVIGHDPDANDSFNPEFGEVDLNMSWDSVFEVRASHSEDAFYYDNPIPLEDVFSKKIIGATNGGIDFNNNCIPFKRDIMIHISHKFFPLKISWNPADFNNVCSINSTITPHQNPLVTFEWWTNPYALAGSACMADTNELIIHTFNDQWLNIFAMDQIEGVGLGRVDGILVSFGNQADWDSPCDKNLVNVDFIDQPVRFSVFPNPTTGFVNLESDEMLIWQLFDTRGKLLATGNEPSLDLTARPNGIYFLSVAAPDGGRSTVKKIVKMNN